MDKEPENKRRCRANAAAVAIISPVKLAGGHLQARDGLVSLEGRRGGRGGLAEGCLAAATLIASKWGDPTTSEGAREGGSE